METAAQYILIVENELTDKKAILDTLNAEGYSVLFARNTLNALRLLVETPPMLVLLGLDSQKPDSYTFARILKGDESTSGITVIAISGDGADTRRISGNGFDGHIVISNNEQNMTRQLKKYLGIQKEK